MPSIARRSSVLPLAIVLAACGAVAPPQPTVQPTPLPTSGATTEPGSPSPSATGLAPAAWSPAPAAIDRIGQDLAALQGIADANGGTRTAGTSGYDESAEWAAARLEGLGFEVSTPEISFTGFRDAGVTLTVGGRTYSGPDEARALIYSPGGTVHGPVAVLGSSGCDPEDFAGVEPGAIVLTTGGGCFRRDQALNASGAGAAALVVGYPDRGPGEIFRPTLLFPEAIDLPVVSVTGDAVRALEAMDGEPVSLEVQTERNRATFRNVLGELGDGPQAIIVGAHLDSVLDGPGINDNGSGVAAALELARAIAETGVPDGWSVRIGFWGAEEFGTYGSRAYAETAGDVAAYLNLDMAGSINGATLVYDEPGAAPGSDAITDAYADWLDARSLAWEPVDLGSSSDHAGFTQAGIPTGGLFAGATATGSAAAPSGGGGRDFDPCYHIGCDDIDNVDVVRVALFGDATAAVVLALMSP